MKASLLALVVSLFVIHSGCAKPAPEPASPTPATGGPEPVPAVVENRAPEEPNTDDPEGPKVKLLTAGTAPKKALRFTAKKGMKKTLVMTMDMTMRMDLGGSPAVQRVPLVKMAMDVVVTEVTSNGDIRYEFTLLEPEVVGDGTTTPAVIEAVKKAVVGLTGMSGKATVTSRGFTKEADIQAPSTANAQQAQFIDSLKQSIRQMCAPVPAEHVGVGATWETTSKLAQNGLSLTQVAKTELVALEGDVVTLKIGMVQSAAPQKITSNGTTVDLQSYEGKGAGESTIDLGQLIPKKAKVTMQSETKVAAGGQQIGIGIDLEMTMGAK